MASQYGTNYSVESRAAEKFIETPVPIQMKKDLSRPVTNTKRQLRVLEKQQADVLGNYGQQVKLSKS